MRIGVLICLLYDMAVWMLSGWGRGRLFDGDVACKEKGKNAAENQNKTKQITRLTN